MRVSEGVISSNGRLTEPLKFGEIVKEFAAGGGNPAAEELCIPNLQIR